MSVTLETISGMDWVRVIDLEDAENTAEMEVVNVAEILTGETETGLFMLVSDIDGNMADEDEEETDEAEAFIFKVCEEEDAEFVMEELNADNKIYVTTNYPEQEYNDAAAIFVETTADFDIEVEENENE